MYDLRLGVLSSFVFRVVRLRYRVFGWYAWRLRARFRFSLFDDTGWHDISFVLKLETV